MILFAFFGRYFKRMSQLICLDQRVRPPQRFCFCVLFCRREESIRQNALAAADKACGPRAVSAFRPLAVSACRPLAVSACRPLAVSGAAAVCQRAREKMVFVVLINSVIAAPARSHAAD